MLDYVAVFLFQFVFNIFKVLEIQYTASKKMKQVLSITVWISALALFSTFFSINQLLQGDYWIIPFFLAGSVSGKWFVMKEMKLFKNIRKKLLI